MKYSKLSLLDQHTLDLIWFFNKWTNFSSEEILRYNIHKLRHTIWVIEKWRDILLKMEQNNRKIKDLADISFILHDIWRFFQNNWNKILSSQEFEHWDWAYGYIKTNYKDNILVALAVKYHNKIHINDLYNEKEYKQLDEENKKLCIFITKLLKDADKLHNMIYLVYNMDNLYFQYSENKKQDISPLVLKSLLNKSLIDKKYIKNFTDNIAIHLSWFFDINFNETIEILNFFSYKKHIFRILKKTWISETNYEKIKVLFSDF